MQYGLDAPFVRFISSRYVHYECFQPGITAARLTSRITMTAARPYRAIVSNSIIASGDNIRQRHHGSGFALKSTLFCSRSMLFYSVLTHFYSSLSKKLVPSPLPATPKLSSTVAPKSQQVERSPRSRPPAGIEGDQASNGTSSRVWSVPV